jgi:UDP-glucose:(glucosyl)LPS alpha-1,2-glucosyltransferase
MRLAILTSTGEVGGAETIDLHTLAALTDLGVELHASIPTEGPLRFRLEEVGAHCYHVHSPEALDRLSRRYASSTDKSLARIATGLVSYESRVLRWLRAVKPDACLALGFRAQLALAPIASTLRLPVAWVASDFMPLDPIACRVWSRVARRQPRIILTYSEASARQPALAGCPTVAIYPGVSLEQFPPGPDDRLPLLLMAGHLTPLKNHLGFLDVMRHVQRRAPEAKGIIAGRCAYRTAPHQRYAKRVAAAVEEFTPRDTVRLVAATSEEIGSLLREAAVLVHLSSVPETFGLVCAEAMASRCPVVVFRRGGLPEVVGDAGALVDPDDLKGAASACVDLLLDGDRWSALADRGRTRVERLFTAKRSGERSASAIVSAFSAKAGVVESTPVGEGRSVVSG